MAETTKPITEFDPAAPAATDSVLGVKGGVVRLFLVEQLRGDASLQLGEAQAYADTQDAVTLAAANAYAVAQDTALLASAQAYASAAAGTAGAEAKAYADNGDSDTLIAAKAYTDSNAGGVSQTYVDNADSSVLASANAYTDALDITPPNGSITLAKLQDITGGSLFGRYTAGSGVPQLITLGSGLNLDTGTGVLSSTGSGAAQSYVDSQDAATLASAQSYTDAATGPNSITLAKLADIATGSLLGRVAGGTGDPQVLTIGAGLVINGTSIEAPGSGSTVTQTGSGAVTRSVQSKVLEIVSIKDFYNSGTDGSNYSPALERAMAAGHTSIYFPEGSYTFSTLVDIVNNIRLLGPSSCFSDNVGGARIQANAGFIRNNSTTRKRIEIFGLSITGNGTDGTRAISGPFGGFISDCRFSHYPVHIENASSFLSRYYRCAFDGANSTSGKAEVGLSLADANTVKVDDCYFSAYVRYGISNRHVTPLSGSSTGAGTGITLIANNFNTSANVWPAQAHVSVYLTGGVYGYLNYFEDYTGSTGVGNQVRFVDLLVNGFGDYHFYWCGNEMNAQGTALNGIYISGSRAAPSPNPCPGEIAYNRMLGFGAGREHIEFGPNNNVPDLQIHDNKPATLLIANKHLQSTYRPCADIGWDTSVSAATATWVTMPIAQDQPLDNADGAGSTSYTIRKNGLHRIVARATINSASAFNAAEMQLLSDGVQIGHAFGSIGAGQYDTMTIHVLRNFTAGDVITLQGRNGGSFVEGNVTLEWLGDGHA